MEEIDEDQKRQRDSGEDGDWKEKEIYEWGEKNIDEWGGKKKG